jgi:ribonuclease D
MALYLEKKSSNISKVKQTKRMSNVICIDFEFSTDTYENTPCVATIVFRDREYLYDLLDLSDVNSLKTLCDEYLDLSVVGFGMSNDMQFIRKYIDYFVSILDLQLLFQKPHQSPPSLKTVVKELFDVDIDKTMQTINWRRRPLTDQMKEYAINDARWTRKVYDECYHMIDWHHMNESQALFDKHAHPERFFKLSTFGLGNKPNEQKVLGFIFWIAREQIAHKMNKNIGFICSNENLKTVIAGAYRSLQSNGDDDDIPPEISLFKCDHMLLIEELNKVKKEKWDEAYDPTTMSVIPYPACLKRCEQPSHIGETKINPHAPSEQTDQSNQPMETSNSSVQPKPSERTEAEEFAAMMRAHPEPIELSPWWGNQENRWRWSRAINGSDRDSTSGSSTSRESMDF